MEHAKNNNCPYCGAKEEKYLTGKCCKENIMITETGWEYNTN